MVAAPFAFVTTVVDARGLVVTSVGDHACRVEPQSAELPWFCDLDDGTPTGENDPASFVRWEGLVVESASWWDSAPTLDHQIGLAVDIARRLAA